MPNWTKCFGVVYEAIIYTPSALQIFLDNESDCKGLMNCAHVIPDSCPHSSLRQPSAHSSEHSPDIVAVFELWMEEQDKMDSGKNKRKKSKGNDRGGKVGPRPRLLSQGYALLCIFVNLLPQCVLVLAPILPLSRQKNYCTYTCELCHSVYMSLLIRVLQI